jgi:uncharacterized repeat protein (TIGR03803 family)
MRKPHYRIFPLLCVVLLFGTLAWHTPAGAYTYTVLHNFTGGVADGVSPNGNLTFSGNTVYGMTEAGGKGYGTVFVMNTDGTGFTVLHSLDGLTGGAYPMGSLSLSGQTLYGMTSGGGGGHGTIEEQYHKGVENAA